jgi:hypothetical protein
LNIFVFILAATAVEAIPEEDGQEPRTGLDVDKHDDDGLSMIVHNDKEKLLYRSKDQNRLKELSNCTYDSLSHSGITAPWSDEHYESTTTRTDGIALNGSSQYCTPACSDKTTNERNTHNKPIAGQDEKNTNTHSNSETSRLSNPKVRVSFVFVSMYLGAVACTCSRCLVLTLLAKGCIMVTLTRHLDRHLSSG